MEVGLLINPSIRGPLPTLFPDGPLTGGSYSAAYISLIPPDIPVWGPSPIEESDPDSLIEESDPDSRAGLVRDKEFSIRIPSS